MLSRAGKRFSPGFFTFLILFFGSSLAAAGSPAVFNVKDYGATGRKTDDARGALQKTIEK